MTALDLDALEKLAARIWSALNDRRYPRFSDMESAAEALEALIAEARSLQARVARWEPPMMTSTASSSCSALLARNGAGEG